MASAKVELVGCLSLTTQGRTFKKGQPVLLTNSEEIAAFKADSNFRVELLAEPKAEAPKPKVAEAPKPEPKPEPPAEPKKAPEPVRMAPTSGPSPEPEDEPAAKAPAKPAVPAAKKIIPKRRGA